MTPKIAVRENTPLQLLAVAFSREGDSRARVVTREFIDPSDYETALSGSRLTPGRRE